MTAHLSLGEAISTGNVLDVQETLKELSIKKINQQDPIIIAMTTPNVSSDITRLLLRTPQVNSNPEKIQHEFDLAMTQKQYDIALELALKGKKYDDALKLLIEEKVTETQYLDLHPIYPILTTLVKHANMGGNVDIQSFAKRAQQANIIADTYKADKNQEKAVEWYQQTIKYSMPEYFSLVGATDVTAIAKRATLEKSIGDLYSSTTMNDSKIAAIWYKRAVISGNTDAMVPLAITEYRLGNYKEAIHGYQETLKLPKTDANKKAQDFATEKLKSLSIKHPKELAEAEKMSKGEQTIVHTPKLFKTAEAQDTAKEKKKEEKAHLANVKAQLKESNKGPVR